jgi:Mg2+ and Co2+ transporter CorA
MNKKFTAILIVLAIVLIAYNVTLVNFENLLEGDSAIALIGIVASLCAIVLLLIFITSKKIQDNINSD